VADSRRNIILPIIGAAMKRSSNKSEEQRLVFRSQVSVVTDISETINCSQV
jgi:hypothetical protein